MIFLLWRLAETEDCIMKVSYKRLWIMMIEKDVSKSLLRRDLKLAPSTMSKLSKGEEVSLSVLLRICGYLECDIGDICEAVRSEEE